MTSDVLCSENCFIIVMRLILHKYETSRTIEIQWDKNCFEQDSIKDSIIKLVAFFFNTVVSSYFKVIGMKKGLELSISGYIEKESKKM